MDVLERILENVWVQRGIWALAVVIFSGVLYHLMTKFLKLREKTDTKVMSQKRNRTFVRIIKSALGYIIFTVTLLIVLQIYGVDVNSMLAGVGIASIVIGFALQDAFKDIFRGFEIITDGYYEIGDVISFGENVGQVVSISLRSTKIQDVNTMNIVSIANRNIDQVEVVSGMIYLTIPMPYDLPVEKSEEVLKDAVKIIKKDENVIDADLLGLSQIADSSLNYTVSVKCDPTVKLPTRRKALRTIVVTLEENKIQMPYIQLDLHAKKK